jgi:hypothetical protein
MPTRVDSVPRPVKPPIPVLSATRTNDERVGQIGIGGDRAADVGGEDSIPIQCHGSANLPSISDHAISIANYCFPSAGFDGTRCWRSLLFSLHSYSISSGRAAFSFNGVNVRDSVQGFSYIFESSTVYSY